MPSILQFENNKQNKNLLPALIILVSVFLLFVVLVPQLSSIFDTKQKIEQKQQSLKSITDVLESIEGSVEKSIDNDLVLAESAYLNLGNVLDIYLGAYSAALNSNVLIKELSTTVGPVYYKDKTQQKPEDFSYITLNVKVVSDNSRNLINYGKEIYTAIPLSEVQRVTTEKDEATYEIKIFQKSYNYANLAQSQQLKAVSARQQKNLEMIRKWKEKNDILLEKLKKEEEEQSILENFASISGKMTLNE